MVLCFSGRMFGILRIEFPFLISYTIRLSFWTCCIFSWSECSPSWTWCSAFFNKSFITYKKKRLKQLLIDCTHVQVSSALLNLRQRNTYPGNTLHPWLKPPSNSSLNGSLTSCYDNSFISQESGSSVVEIVDGSRLRAHTMVDAAIQVWRASVVSLSLWLGGQGWEWWRTL